MKKILSNNYSLAIISGLLLMPGWYEWGTGLSMMVAFVPLLVIIERLIDQPKGGREVFLLASVAILVWNDSTTWWIKNASYLGMITAFFASAFYMSIPIWLTFKVRKAWGQKAGLFAFVVFWLAFEFVYLHGEVSFPWLMLGNGFAYETRLFQWYDITGVLGGSLWVLLVNVLVFQTFFSKKDKFSYDLKKSIWTGIFLLIPIIFSVVKYYTYEEEHNPRKIIVVQPNIDAYLKFSDIPGSEQTEIQVRLALSKLDSTVDYVVAPETSVNNDIWIGKFDSVPDFNYIQSLHQNFPKMKYVTGITCSQRYSANDPISKTANKYDKTESYFDYFNSAIQIDTTKTIQIYHKSKLVLGEEKMPYPGMLRSIDPLLVRLGIKFQSIATQQNREVFTASEDSVKIAPVICYESIFGDYMTDYIKLGAGLIFVITNDGWWGDTPGYHQHNALSSLRAVEMRRSIARSANTGISCFINQRGDVVQRLNWWKRDAIIGELNVNTKLTFYTKHGDFIGHIGFVAGIFLILILVAKALRSKT